MKLVGRYGTYNTDDEPFVTGGEADLRHVPGADLLYKRYLQPKHRAADAARLEEVVQTGRKLMAHASPEHPARRLNLPIDLVRDEQHSTVLGVVVPQAPRHFMRETGVRDLTRLYYRRSKPPPPEASSRLAVIVALAESLAVLHEAGWAHGDLSASNVLWSSKRPLAGAYVIDCDGVFRQTTAGPPERFTPGWRDPRQATGEIRAHDAASDVYALALAIWRVITLLTDRENQDARYADAVVPQVLPASVPRATRGLLEACFSRPLEPSARATAVVFRDTLRDDFFPAGRARLGVLRRIDDPSPPPATGAPATRKLSAERRVTRDGATAGTKPAEAPPPGQTKARPKPPPIPVPSPIPAPPPSPAPPPTPPPPPVARPTRRGGRIAPVLVLGATMVAVAWASGAFSGHRGAATSSPAPKGTGVAAQPSPTPASDAGAGSQAPTKPKARKRKPKHKAKRNPPTTRRPVSTRPQPSGSGRTGTPQTPSAPAQSVTPASGASSTHARPAPSGSSGTLKGTAGPGGGSVGGLTGTAGSGGSGGGAGGLTGSAGPGG